MVAAQTCSRHVMLASVAGVDVTKHRDAWSLLLQKIIVNTTRKRCTEAN